MHYLTEYQSFVTTKELNDAVYAHIKRNTYELNETDRATLKAIARYAVKFAGAAHLKAETIAHLISKSIKTARRAVNKLAELGIIKKIETTRKVSGGKGANIIVILPLPQSDQSQMSNRKECEIHTESNSDQTKIENEPLDSINLKNNILDTATPPNALKSTLPNDIYNAMARYFNAEEIYNYYGILLRAKASIDPTLLIEDDPEPFVEAWNATILKVKQGKVRKMCDYLYASFRQAAVTVWRRIHCKELIYRAFSVELPAV
jgi:hypothetical protein